MYRHTSMVALLSKPAISGALIVLLALSIIPWSDVWGDAEKKASTPRNVPAPVTIDFQIAKKEIVGGFKTVRARLGDTVTLRFTSDKAEEVHLHGYNRTTRVVPGVPAEIKVSLNRTGRFTIEGHTSQLEIGAIEVYPK